jgi:hypothetical protein
MVREFLVTLGDAPLLEPAVVIIVPFIPTRA